jgi:NADH-quinone oxidoreductase subunit H
MVMFFSVLSLLELLVVIVPLLISVAYFTLAERKIMGAMQRRKGPNVIGIFGLLQPLADGLKLFAKETILPSTANTSVFLLAPIISFLLSLMG